MKSKSLSLSSEIPTPLSASSAMTISSSSTDAYIQLVAHPEILKKVGAEDNVSARRTLLQMHTTNDMLLYKKRGFIEKNSEPTGAAAPSLPPLNPLLHSSDTLSAP